MYLYINIVFITCSNFRFSSYEERSGGVRHSNTNNIFVKLVFLSIHMFEELLCIDPGYWIHRIHGDCINLWNPISKHTSIWRILVRTIDRSCSVSKKEVTELPRVFSNTIWNLFFKVIFSSLASYIRGKVSLRNIPYNETCIFWGALKSFPSKIYAL